MGQPDHPAKPAIDRNQHGEQRHGPQLDQQLEIVVVRFVIDVGQAGRMHPRKGGAPVARADSQYRMVLHQLQRGSPDGQPLVGAAVFTFEDAQRLAHRTEPGGDVDRDNRGQADQEQQEIDPAAAGKESQHDHPQQPHRKREQPHTRVGPDERQRHHQHAESGTDPRELTPAGRLDRQGQQGYSQRNAQLHQAGEVVLVDVGPGGLGLVVALGQPVDLRLTELDLVESIEGNRAGGGEDCRDHQHH